MGLAGWQPSWTEVMHGAGLHRKVLAMVIWMSLVNIFIYIYRDIYLYFFNRDTSCYVT